jgi:hypothetical protein
LQLLVVACLWLSLAIKLEEHHAHALRLLEFQLDAYEFDSASILRMELLVLGTLHPPLADGRCHPLLLHQLLRRVVPATGRTSIVGNPHRA